MECPVEPFSAAIVYLADKYVESFPCKKKLLIYLQELCAELDINMMSMEKPIIMKGPWGTVIQMEKFLNTLLSELQQCILSREENPSLQNLSQAFAHCSNLFTNKKEIGGTGKECVEQKILPEVDITSESSQSILDVQKANEDAQQISQDCSEGTSRGHTNNTISPIKIAISESTSSSHESDHLEINLCHEELKCELPTTKKKSNPCGSKLRRSKRSTKTKLHNSCKTLLPSKKKHVLPAKKYKKSSDLNFKSAQSSISCSRNSIDGTEIKLYNKRDREETFLPTKLNSQTTNILSRSTKRKASKRPCKIEKDVKFDSITKKGKSHQTNDTGKLDVVFNCEECGYETKSSNSLEEHMKRVHLARQFKCPECSKEFGLRKDLRRHMKCHGTPQHSCEVCGKKYKEANKLKAHQETHGVNYVKPQFSCQQCSKSFSTKYTLSYHINSEHLGMASPFVCECGKSFTQKNSYLQHANVHKGVKPFSCDICKMQFSYQKSMKEHMFLHSNTKHFKCSVCNKTFKQSSCLNVHMRIHKETKGYVCAICGREFRQRQALLRHERIHAGEKPFECCLCTKFFGDSSVLRRHMLFVHKRSRENWQNGTQRHTEAKTASSVSVVSDSPHVEKKDESGYKSCGQDSNRNAERKDSGNIILDQKEVVSKSQNENESTGRSAPSLSLKHTDQDRETCNFADGNLKIDLFFEEGKSESTDTNPAEQVPEPQDIMLSPVAQVIVCNFRKLTPGHHSGTAGTGTTSSPQSAKLPKAS